MSKVVESYRIALEEEISRWSGFAKALRKPDREAFEEILGMCRSYVLESSDAANPVTFEPMVMSILLAQQARIWRLEKKLDMMVVKAGSSAEDTVSLSENHQADIVSSQVISVRGEQARLN